MRKCPVCGAAVHKNAAFCTNCGSRIEMSREQNPDQRGTSAKKGRGGLILILIIVLVIVGGIAGFLLVNSSPESRLRRQLSLGDKYYTELDYDRAIAAYGEALEIDPKNEDALFGIAHSYQERGQEELEDGSDDYYEDFAAAKEYYEQAISYYPDSNRAQEAQEEIAKIVPFLNNTGENTVEPGEEPAAANGEEEVVGEEVPEAYEDAEEQLNLIAESYSQWNRINMNEVPNSGFTVADLNNNGRLEIIVSGIMGTGAFSETYVFEVNEERTGLVECVYEEEYSPDIINVPSAVIYQSDENYMIICDDAARAGWQDYYVTRQSLSLQNNNVITQTLGSSHTHNSSDGTSEEEYFDGDNNPISAEEFEQLADTAFPGCPKGEINFKWISLYDAQSDYLGSMRESWEGFSCSLFFPKEENMQTEGEVQ